MKQPTTWLRVFIGVTLLTLIVPAIATLDGPSNAQFADIAQSDDVYNQYLYLPSVRQDPPPTATSTPIATPFPTPTPTAAFEYNEDLDYNLTQINVEGGWNESASLGRGIVIAVVDTGIDEDHPQLQANMVLGINLVENEANTDLDGHGTHVAGIAGSTANNGNTIGVAPNVNLMPIKSLGEGGGTVSDVANGIIYAADNGADIINMSLIIRSDSSTLRNAIDYANNRGILLIAAAGNCGNPSFFRNGCTFINQTMYPAGYDSVISVAATDADAIRADFSSQNDSIEIAAPGDDIFSTSAFAGYQTIGGTSQSAPHVAGLAALIWADNPSLSAAEIRAHINATASDRGSSGLDGAYGYGIIDVAAAVTTDISPITEAEITPTERVEVQYNPDAPFTPGEILVTLQPDTTLDEVLNTAGLANVVTVIDSIPALGVVVLAVPDGAEASFIAQLAAVEGVSTAELNYIAEVSAIR